MRNVGLIYLARVKFLQRGKVKTFTEYKFVKKDFSDFCDAIECLNQISWINPKLKGTQVFILKDPPFIWWHVRSPKYTFFWAIVTIQRTHNLTNKFKTTLSAELCWIKG